METIATPLPPDTIGVILAMTNVLLGIVLAAYQIKYYRLNGNPPWSWIKIIMAFLGVYWAAVYVIVLLQNFGFIQPLDPVWFGRIFIRPAITLFLGTNAAASILRWRS